MFKDSYFSNIISNLGIAINQENNSEIIVKTVINFDKKNDNYILSDEYDIFYQEYGTVIADFQNTDFSNKDEFIYFYNKYNLFGLENKKIKTLFSNNICPSSKYNQYVDSLYKKYYKKLITLKMDINSILDYCIFNPPKNTVDLSPFERLCILEYLPNTPSLLQENQIQVIHLNTLSNLDTSTYKENEIIEKIKTGKYTAYQNFLYIPTDISSLLNLELNEIIKDNVILKICNYCKRYFIASNRNLTYCNNIAPGYKNKTCRQIARNKMYLQSKKSDEALALFTKVYNSKAYKASRYKDISEYQLDYKHFQQIGKKKIEKYKNKQITKDDFIDWINRNK